MGAAIITSFLFATSAIFGSRSTRLFGSYTANLSRMVVALVLLALWSFTFGRGFAGPGIFWLLISGCVGFGFGDLALFGALPRIGPRLALLLTQCLAGPIAGWAEWVWLGQRITLEESFCAGLTLIGVAVALLPHRKMPAPRFFWTGVGFGVLSALGQGLGAVTSRKANVLNLAALTPIDGGTAAFQRMLGGFCVTTIFILLATRRGKWTLHPFRAGRLPVGWHLILLNGLAGPTLGVGFFQFALATTPSAIVLSIVATSPVIAMLLLFVIGEEKPGVVSILGALTAVGGAVALAIMTG